MSRERNRPKPLPEDASFDDEAILQNYIARLMTMQDERTTWLEEADLQQAAQDLGLSDTELQHLDAVVAAHHRRGDQFLDRRLWDEAIDAFRQASALAPFRAELFHRLAQAHLGRWRATGSEADRQAADRYAHRTLELDPDHAAAYEVLRELKRPRTASATPSRASVRFSLVLLSGAMVLLLVLIAAALFFVLA